MPDFTAVTDTETAEQLQRWLITGDVGMSSRAIAAHMSGFGDSVSRGDHPYDVYDFGRCHQLLEAVPKYKDRIAEMAQYSETWAELVARWVELSLLYRSGDRHGCHNIIQNILVETRKAA